MRALLLAFLLLPLSACYLGTRMGPAAHTSSLGGAQARTGFEWDVTAGVEVHFDEPAVFNPLAGSTRFALGGGGVSSSSPAQAAPPNTPRTRLTPSRAADGMEFAGGFFSLELGHTLWQRASGGKKGDPDTGWLVRGTGVLEEGGGTLRFVPADGGPGAYGDADLHGGALGVEALWHTGGSTVDSFGVALGAGVRWTELDAGGLGRASSTAPYLSITMEGGLVMQMGFALLQAMGSGGGGGCH